MKNGTSLRRRALPLALACCAALAACDERGALAPPLEPVPPARTLGVLTCRADPRRGDLRCDEARPGAGGASAALILGGQGTNVRLASSGTSYDAATGVFQSNVTVQNLTSQRLGSLDTTTPTGVKVFFHSGPIATAGTGIVEVANADGVGSFTGSAQPYFEYPGVMLETRGTTDPRTWRFDVPPTVESFAFTVYVVADVPFEEGTLRWTRVRGAAAGGAWMRSVWAASPSSVWAVAANGVILHYDGSSWTSQVAGAPSTNGLNDVSGTSATDVWAVGDGGNVLHWNGKGWFRVLTVNPNLYGVWAVAPNRMVAVGDSAIVEMDMNVGDAGEIPLPAGTRGKMLTDVWGSAPGDLWVVGEKGTVLHYAGAAWTVDTSFPDSTAALRGVWGTPEGDVFVVGAGNVAYRRSGGTWTAIPPAAAPDLFALWGTSSADVYAAASTGVLRWDGSAWSQATPSSEPLRGVWGAGGTVYAVGRNGTLMAGSGAGWTTQPQGAADSLAVWMGSPTEGYAVGAGGRILRWDGAAWTPETSPTTARLYGVHGVDGVVVAVGNGGIIIKRENGVWAPVGTPQTRITTSRLLGVYVVSATKAYLVGENGSIVTWSGGQNFSLLNIGVGQGYVFTAIHGSSADNIWVVGSPSRVYRRTATGWASTAPAGVSASYSDVWVSPGGEVYLTGAASIQRYSNGTWTAETLPGNLGLAAVWGTGAGDVYAVGSAGALMRRTASGAWRNMRSGTGDDLRGIWGTSATDVWAAGTGGAIVHGTR